MDMKRSTDQRNHPWGDPARWSAFSCHSFVECECGCSSAESRRPCYHQVDHRRLRKGLLGMSCAPISEWCEDRPKEVRFCTLMR